MIIPDNNYIVQKHELVRKLDKATDKNERLELSKELGLVEKKIYEQTTKYLEEGLKNPIPVKNDTKEYDEKALRKILKEKYGVYQELAKKSRVLYADLVAKKRDVNRVLALVKKKNKKMVEETLRY